MKKIGDEFKPLAAIDGVLQPAGVLYQTTILIVYSNNCMHLHSIPSISFLFPILMVRFHHSRTAGESRRGSGNYLSLFSRLLPSFPLTATFASFIGHNYNVAL